ncbi:MAG TPA: RNA-binding protein [Xanthomonadales bacterium]|nr:RNA-binding protein [Xanthomonadales bacterium]
MLKLFVGNLPAEANEKYVKELFAEFGTVRSLDLAHDIFTGKCKGFCFVEMEGHEARAAQSSLDGKPLDGGGFLKVRMEIPRRGGRGRR